MGKRVLFRSIFRIVRNPPLVSQATYAFVDCCRMRDRIALHTSYGLLWSSSTQMTSRNGKLADGRGSRDEEMLISCMAGQSPSCPACLRPALFTLVDPRR